MKPTMQNAQRFPRVGSHGVMTALLAMATVLLASCYWQPDIPGSGAVRFEIEAVSSNEVSTLEITENAARIFLIAGTGSEQRFFPLGGRGVPDLWVSFSSGRAIVEIENVPDGAVYRLFVAAGQAFPRTGAFHVSRYGSSAPFKVAAGSEVSVGVTLESAPQVAWALSGAAVNSLVWEVDGEGISTLFTASGSRVFDLDWSPGVRDIPPGLSRRTDYGVENATAVAQLTRGMSSSLIVSTPDGLFAGPNVFRDTTTFTELRPSRARNPIPALSAAQWEPAGTRSLVIDSTLFSTANGIGGRARSFETNEPESPTILGWFFVDTSRQVKGAPVLDATTTGEGYAFVSSRMGAFRISAEAVAHLASTSDATVLSRNTSELLDASIVFDQLIPAPILALHVIGDAASSALLVGTQDGLFLMGNVLGATWSPRSASGLGATRGRPISSIAAIGTGETQRRVAAVSPFELFIIDVSGTSVTSISTLPFIAAYPGTPSDLVWLSATHLAISGSEGVVVLSVPE